MGYSLGLKPIDPITFDPFTSTGDSIRDQTSSSDPQGITSRNFRGHKLAELLGIFSPGGGNSKIFYVHPYLGEMMENSPGR